MDDINTSYGVQFAYKFHYVALLWIIHYYEFEITDYISENIQFWHD